MQKIIPNLWFNGNAEEAVDFYASAFSAVAERFGGQAGTKVVSTSHYPKSKEEGLADFQLNMAGKVLTIDFEIMGFRFAAINAGPEFTPNPSISFTVSCKSTEEVGALWHALIEGGQALMELGEYPFSKYYGWLNDKYGVSWQIIVRGEEGVPTQPITPGLMFTKDNVGRAEEAMRFYTSIFPDSKIESIFRYENQHGETDGNIAHALFILNGQQFIAQESAGPHDFTFNEGVSLLINCNDQAEIDYYWEKLTADGEESVCGWLKDKYGVSWQVAPANMEELMAKPGAFKTMMGQKKIIIAEY